jgi:hypothetical protein
MSSIAKTADHLASQARTATLATRASLIDLGSQALCLANSIREREPSGLFLAQVGRRREPNRFASLLWFATGAAVVGGAVTLFAPRGAALKSRVGSLFNGARASVGWRDHNGEESMANEGGGSIPRDEEHQGAR